LAEFSRRSVPACPLFWPSGLLFTQVFFYKRGFYPNKVSAPKVHPFRIEWNSELNSEEKTNFLLCSAAFCCVAFSMSSESVTYYSPYLYMLYTCTVRAPMIQLVPFGSSVATAALALDPGSRGGSRATDTHPGLRGALHRLEAAVSVLWAARRRSLKLARSAHVVGLRASGFHKHALLKVPESSASHRRLKWIELNSTSHTT
jgi:hypothetical protein